MFTLNVEELPRVNEILSDARYMQLVQEIEELEKDRIFCRHGFEHFLNVARIACILNQE